VNGWKQRIRFIQMGSEWDVPAAMKRLFPLDVERVGFDVRRDGWLAQRRVRKSIAEGKAKIDLVTFECHGCPQVWEIEEVTAGLRKMTAYSRRGFDFDEGGGASLKGNGVFLV